MILRCFFFVLFVFVFFVFVFFQAEDGIRDLVRSRGLGDVYKRQVIHFMLAYSYGPAVNLINNTLSKIFLISLFFWQFSDLLLCQKHLYTCLLYTSDAADERSSVDLGGRRIIKKKKNIKIHSRRDVQTVKQQYNQTERL